VTDFIVSDPQHENRTHCFRFINGVPLNQASQAELQVNFLEYWEVADQEGEGPKILKHFSWVTDILLTKENAHEIMRGGRARWRIENETFNTLKNQGYNLGHNYGLGKKHLSAVFVHLTMLAGLPGGPAPATLLPGVSGGPAKNREQDTVVGVDQKLLPSFRSSVDGDDPEGYRVWR
jgi:hypothetical protein